MSHSSTVNVSQIPLRVFSSGVTPAWLVCDLWSSLVVPVPLYSQPLVLLDIISRELVLTEPFICPSIIWGASLKTQIQIANRICKSVFLPSVKLIAASRMISLCPAEFCTFLPFALTLRSQTLTAWISLTPSSSIFSGKAGWFFLPFYHLCTPNIHREFTVALR